MISQKNSIIVKQNHHEHHDEQNFMRSLQFPAANFLQMGQVPMMMPQVTMANTVLGAQNAMMAKNGLIQMAPSNPMVILKL
jgi:hypothetical protein